MSPETADRIEQTILAHLNAEVDCRLLSEEDGRVGCATPLEYPNGDQVVVWVRPREDGFEVTDYGEALADFAPHKGQERKGFEELAQVICRGQGVRYAKGRLTVRSDWVSLGEVVWRLAFAAAHVSQAASTFRPRKRREENEFVAEVERTMRSRQLSIERDHRIEGRSGHEHQATIFVPTTEAVVEPVGGHWNQVTATYAKFGDLLNTNGFRLYSLLDDRAEPPDEDVSGLLVQVSRVIEWTRRDEWFDSVASASPDS
jgi:hypothetical protein